MLLPRSEAPKVLVESLNKKLDKLINVGTVMLFMKGDPDSPRCGFSSKIVQILRTQKVDFSSFDILSDDSVREGLKAYSDWPTFPQLYIKGELIGGLDIVEEMVGDGSFQEMLEEA